MKMATKQPSKSAKDEFLDSLSDQDRRVYQAIDEQIDFVDNPDFRKRSTEGRLFGDEAAEIQVRRWRQYPALDDGEYAPTPKATTKLTGRQEAELFMRYNYARYHLARLATKQGKRFGKKRAAEMVLWQRRVMETRAALANANMALVVAMAKRTRINSVEFGELVSEGNMALLRALDKFDVARGFKFSTYGCRAILKSFNRLATKTGTYRQHFPTEFDPDMERSDEIDRRHTDQRELAIEDLHRVLIHNSADLSDVEREVVGARFAVAGFRDRQTLEQVGQLVGLSKERVRQVQNDALGKLREAMVCTAG